MINNVNIMRRLCEESEDLESDDFWKRQWMFDRNNETRALALAQRASLCTGRLDESLHVHRVSPGQVMMASHLLMELIHIFKK